MARKPTKPLVPPTRPRVSNPASTGGAGAIFEQHVNAHWLALLLVRGIPPILLDCVVVEVSFQTERLGWCTDDFLVIGENGSGNPRRLVGQVKRKFTVSAADDECKKTILDYWQDFKKDQQFSAATDRFALVTLRGTNTLLEHFSGLLGCARSARDGAEFESRLATPGFLNAKAVHYCDEVRAIIGESEGSDVSAAAVWPLLRVLHVLSLDLNSSTGQTEAAIKNLLAHTASEQNSLAAAEASWNELLREVGKGMPEARTYKQTDLPEALLSRHASLGGAEQRALSALQDHSRLILDGIRSTIGRGLHLGRDSLIQRVVDQLGSSQVLVISGPAGSGKSGIAKEALDILSPDHFTFCFRAVELALPHLNQMLQQNQIPANAALLGAVLAGQGRKVLLIESVERLLEASTRDAFTDLLTLVSADKSWQLVMTCRDYSTDLVRWSFLQATGIGHALVTVPPLEDAELDDVRAAEPSLARLLSNTPLRRLLRNLYILDSALRMPWLEDCPLPASERDFRARFWQDIVRADHRAAAGMPRRREQVFVQIALRRAQALTLYAASGDLDTEVVDGLCRDSLIVRSEQSRVLLAPAHDVLEDWAILMWLDEQHATQDRSATGLAASIGPYPALRRTYRKWVGELTERNAAAADALFQAAVADSTLPAHFRDDTLVSLLRSPASVAFLERHVADLLARDKQLLRRVIHLLRVACVTTPAWLNTTLTHGSLFNVPDGPAWACVLQVVQSNLALFDADDLALLLGLIEDWSRGVSWQQPYPEGNKSVAAIAHWLLPQFDDYRADDQRERTLQVIAKIPNADRKAFAALLRGHRKGEERDQAAGEMQAIIFEGLDGMPAARDMPDLVVSVVKRYLMLTEESLKRRWEYGGALELEPLFGIDEGRSHDFFPASAYRGPFFHLLRHHPDKGVALVLSIFNHSADWYAHPRTQAERIEPPVEMNLAFADGTTRKQWCNGRLWNLYRGTTVGPDVLQSILMALELWLLELAELQPKLLDTVLLHILRQSDSAAPTGVAASVATAFPYASGETLLVLLRSPECILLDRHRLVAESQSPSRLSSLMSSLRPNNRSYDEERKQADARPHRCHDLETAVINLQLGPFAGRVHEVLDRHRAAMPPAAEQDEGDRIWRLSLHRMDLRRYTVAEDQGQAPVAGEGESPPVDDKKPISLKLDIPEPDIKEMASQSESDCQATNARLGLLMWGMKLFKRENDTTHDPAQWRKQLQKARAAYVSEGDMRELGGGGPGYVAAVCVRDNWKEMSGEERDWCADVVCTEVERDADNWNQFARGQRYGVSADRPCSWVVSQLVGKKLSDPQQARVRQVLVVALTHAIDEVRWYATWGVGENIWTIDRDLALRCVNAFAAEASMVQEANDEERARILRDKEFTLLHSGGWGDRIEAKAAATVRQRFFRADGIPADALQNLDPSHWFGAEASARIFTILRQAPNEPAAVPTFAKLAQTLVRWWDADDDDRMAHQQRRPERNHDTESALTDCIEDFLLRTSPANATAIVEPILAAVDRHPREVSWILLGLVTAEDRRPATPQFWHVWRLFADRIRHAKWITRLDDEHCVGSEVISAIFLGSFWKDHVRHWRSLEGYADHVHLLFEDLPPCSLVLDDYAGFLHHVGDQSLPGAFVRIARRLKQGDPAQMLRKRNTVCLLEVLLQRYVYGRPLELKQRADLRNAVLDLLDTLVENGSSAAFRMRDDFVTPIPVG
ncbi:MAG: nSTAND1 domain-containing NTPase [Minisyncoccota bacterium]